jgi:excisionase family DNA binding protein
MKERNLYMTETLLTLQEAADKLQCHPETLRRAILRGELKAGRLGKEYRIDERDLIQFVYRDEEPQAEVK